MPRRVKRTGHVVYFEMEEKYSPINGTFTSDRLKRMLEGKYFHFLDIVFFLSWLHLLIKAQATINKAPLKRSKLRNQTLSTGCSITGKGKENVLQILKNGYIY